MRVTPPIVVVSSAVLTASALLTSPALASALPRAGKVLDYVIVDQDLRDALAGIGREIGVRVEVSEQVKGRVHGRLPRATVSRTLSNLASIFGFDYYYSGGVLAISSYAEADSKILSLGRVDPSTLSRALVDLGVADERWPLRTTEGGIAMVSGPPRYIAGVEKILATLSERKVEEVTVHAFHGVPSNAQ